MAAEANVLSDSSLLSRLDRALLPIERVTAMISGIAALSLIFLAAYSVGGRYLFDSPLKGYVDLIEWLMPLIAIMGVSYVQRGGGHVRMDILIGALKGRLLWALELLATVLILALMIGLVWGAWAHVERSFDFALAFWSRDSTMDISIPLWPSKIVVPIAFSVLCLRLILQIWGYSRALLLGLEHPAAVPLVQSVEEHALEEASRMDGSGP